MREAGVAEWPDGTLSGRYSFRHALYHEVVYAQLAEVRRVQLHRRIAERKEAAYGERVGEIAAELAMHFEKGRDLTRAVQYLGKAGETAVRRSAHQEAIAHLTKGLDLLATFPETPERDSARTSAPPRPGRVATRHEGVWQRRKSSARVPAPGSCVSREVNPISSCLSSGDFPGFI